MSDFRNKVYKAVKKVPHGKVVSYGQVATYIGSPRSARQVGWVLSQSAGTDVPWWRVINSEGRISINNKHVSKDEQRMYLASEGIKVTDNYNIDINYYGLKAEVF